MTEKTRVKLGAYFLFALLLLTLPVTLLVTHWDTARHAPQWKAGKDGVQYANANYRPRAVQWAKKTYGLSTEAAERFVRRTEKAKQFSSELTDNVPYGARLDYYKVENQNGRDTARFEGSATVVDPLSRAGRQYVDYVRSLPREEGTRDFIDQVSAQLKKGTLLVPAWFGVPVAGAAARDFGKAPLKASTSSVTIAVVCTVLPGFRDISPRSDGDQDANDSGTYFVDYNTRTPSATPSELCYRQMAWVPKNPPDLLDPVDDSDAALWPGVGYRYNYADSLDTPAGTDEPYHVNDALDSYWGSIFDSPGGVFSTAATWGVPVGVPGGWDYTQEAMAPHATHATNLLLQDSMFDLFFDQSPSAVSISNWFYQQTHGLIRVDGTESDIAGWLRSAHQTNRYMYQVGGGNQEFVFPGTPVIRTGRNGTSKPVSDAGYSPATPNVVRATLSSRGCTILFSQPASLPTDITTLAGTVSINAYTSTDVSEGAATAGGTVAIVWSQSAGSVIMDPYDARRWTITNPGGNSWKFQQSDDTSPPSPTYVAFVSTSGGAWTLSVTGWPLLGGSMATVANSQMGGCPQLTNTAIVTGDMRISQYNHSALDSDGEGYPAWERDGATPATYDYPANTSRIFRERPFARLKSMHYYTHSYSGSGTYQITHLSNEWNNPDDISGTQIRNTVARVYPYDTAQGDPWNGGRWPTGATVREGNAGDYAADVRRVLSDNSIDISGYTRTVFVAADGGPTIPGSGESTSSGFQPTSSLENVNESGAGVAFHELAHSLINADDIYDNDLYNNRTVPAPSPTYPECMAMNVYSIMDAGGRLDAWHLIKKTYGGNHITTPVAVQADTLGAQIPEVEGMLRDPVILKVPANPYYIKKGITPDNWQEYFLIENRNVVAGDGNGAYGFDSSTKGLYIYHIDDTRNPALNNANQAGFQRDNDLLSVIIEQADGLHDLEFTLKGAAWASGLTSAQTYSYDPFGSDTATHVSRFWQYPMQNGDTNDFSVPVVLPAMSAGSPTSYSHGYTYLERDGTSNTIIPGTETDSFARVVKISNKGTTMTADIYVEPAEIKVTATSLSPATVQQGDDDVPMMRLQLDNEQDLTVGKTDQRKMSTKDVYLDTLRILESGTSTDPNNLSAVKIYADSNTDGNFTIGTDALLAQTTLQSTGRYQEHAVFDNLGYRVPLNTTRYIFICYDIAPEAKVDPQITLGAEFTDATKIMPRLPGTVQVRTRNDANLAADNAADYYNFGAYRFPMLSNTTVVHNHADRLTVNQPTGYAYPDADITPGQSTVPALRLQLQTNKDGNTRTEGYIRIAEVTVEATPQDDTPLPAVPPTANFSAPSELLNAVLYQDVNKNGSVDAGDTQLAQSSFTLNGALQQATFYNLDIQVLAGSANAVDLLAVLNVAPGAKVGHRFKMSVQFPDPGDWASGKQDHSYVKVFNPANETIAGNKDWVEWQAPDANWAGNVSGTFTLVQPNSAPNRPTAGFAPTGGDTVFDQNPRLDWTAADDPDGPPTVPAGADTPATLSYRVDLATDGTFNNIVRTVDTTPSGQNWWVVPGLPLPAGTYYWRVRTKDSHGAYSVQWSDTQQFVVQLNSPPNRVTAGFDPNGIVATTLTPRLTWTKSTDPDPLDPQSTLSYEVEVDDNSDFSSPLPIGPASATRWSGAANINYVDLPTAAGLQWGIQYYWRVRCLDDQSAASAWTNEAPGALSIWFRTVQDRAPYAPIAAFAPNGGTEISTANPVLTWNMPNPPDPDSPSDALANIHYEVQLGTSADLASLVSYTYTASTSNGVMTTTVNTTDLLDNTQYWWRVRALDDQSPTNLTSPWSPVQTFWVNIRNNAPTAPSADFDPANGATVNTQTPTLSWDNSVDPDPDQTDGAYTDGAATPPVTGVSWIVQLSNDPFFATVQYTYTTGPLAGPGRPSVLVTTPLSPNIGNTNWYWKVTAVDNDGAPSSPTSAMYHFKVQTTGSLPNPPTAGFVPGNGTNISTTNALRLEWGPGSDVEDAVGALRYEVVLASTANFAPNSSYLWSSGLIPAGRQYVDVPPVPALTLGATYYWHVRTVDTANMRSVWSGTQSTTVVSNNAPNAVTTGFWPTGTLQISDTTPTLTWNAATPPDPDADDTAATMTYKVEVADNTNFTNPIYAATVAAGSTPLTPTATVPTALSVGVRYYWHIRPVDRKGLQAAAWSANQDFRIVANQAPAAPTNGFDPSDGEEVNSAKPRIQWNAGTDPNNDDTAPFLSYQVQVKENSSDFSNGPFAVDTMTPAGQNWYDVTTALNDNSHYYYRIRTFDDGSPALSSEWTASAITHFYVNTVNNAPTAPTTGFDPPTNATVTTATPTLSWDNSTDPDPDPFDGNVTLGQVIGVHFRVELSRDNFATTAFTYVTNPGVSSKTTGTLADGSWSWRVYAIDDDGQASLTPSATQTFTIDPAAQAPSEPLSGFNPTGGRNVSDTTPTLSWDPATDPNPADTPDTLHYEVELSTDNTFTRPPAPTTYFWSYTTADGIAQATVPNANLLTTGRTYYWHVRTVDSTNLRSVSWSVTQSFVCGANQPPTAPVSGFWPTGPLPTGLGISDPTPTLVWDPGTDPDANDTASLLRYNVQLDDNNDFSSLTFSGTTGYGVTSLTCLTTLAEGATYYWRVQTQDQAGALSGWSGTQVFHIVSNHAPETPIGAFAPPDDTGSPNPLNTANPTLSWNMPNPADPDPNDTVDTIKYEIQLNDKQDLSAGPYVFTTVTAVNVMQAICTTNLTDNKQYWWRVRSIDQQGLTSDWTSVMTFWINLVNQKPLPPDAGFSPANGQQISDSTPLMSWNDGTDVDPDDTSGTLHYVVELSKDNFATAAAYQYTTTDGVTQTTPTVALTDLTTWYWRVRTVDNSGAQSDKWSEVQNFRLDTLNQLPTLSVSDVPTYHCQPLYGALGTGYELYVTYTDPENDLPQWVRCTFDNGVGPLDMRKVNPADNNATDGILFVVGVPGTALGLGAHGHFFTCDAGTRLPAVRGTLRGPVIGVASTLRLTNGNYVDATQYEEGSPIYIEVVDADQNANSGALDTLSVTLTTAGGDSETLGQGSSAPRLVETGNATGRFRGSIPTLGKAGAVDDGALNVIGGITGMAITATYSDPNDAAVTGPPAVPGNATPDTSSDTATVVDTKAPAPITTAQLQLASGPHGRTVDLDWAAYDEAGQVDVAGYHVWASTSKITLPGSLTPLATLPAGTQTYTATKLPNTTQLTPNTTYWFAISAFDEGNREVSAVQSASVITRDTTAPILGSQNPSPGTPEVALNTAISFDLDDQGIGVDQSTLTVTLKQRNGTTIPHGPLTITGDRYLMQVSLTPTQPLAWNDRVSVVVDVKDFDGNQLLLTDTDWTFDTVTDTILPTLDDQSPAPNATSVPVSTNVSFSLHDTGSGINRNATVLNFNGTVIPVADLVFTNLSDGVRVTYDPPGDLQYNAHYTVSASGADAAGNVTAPANWGFDTVVDAGQVTVDQFDPARGAVDVPINTNISFRMSDPLAGIKESTFKLTVDGTDVTNSGNVTIIKVPAGSAHPTTMAVSYNPPSNFNYSSTVTVNVYAEDDLAVPNVTDLTYTFRTIDAPTYNVSGIITDGAAPTPNPIAGVTVTAGGQTAQTDGNGAYRIGGLLAGDYTVVATRDQYVFTPPNAGVTVGPDDAIANFQGTLLTYAVSGHIQEAGVGLAGVTVTCNGQTATTDAAGAYQISGLPNGQYTVTATKTNYHFQPPTKAVQVNGANATGVNFDAIADTFTVEGTITDNTGARVEGAQVDCGGKAAVTNAAGHFLIAGLRAGSYTVTPTKSGYLMDPLSRNVTVPPSRTAVDFSAYIEIVSEFPSGLNLLAVPGTPVDTNPMNVFGINPLRGESCARWNPAAIPPQYLVAQNDPTAEPLQVKPGRGFFVNFNGNRQLRIPGTPTSAVGTTSIGLSEGWNMIGNPRSAPLKFSKFVPNIPGGIRNVAFVYDNAAGSYLMVSSDASLGAVRDSLLPWEGAWVRATSGGVSLLVSGASTADAKGTMKPQQAELNGGWMIPVVARAGNRADLSSVAGAVPGAGASHSIENPPTAPQTVDVYFTDGSGTRLAHDVRDSLGKQSFTFVVACSVPDANVSVTLPDLSSVPADQQVLLVDKETGKTMYARTMQSYSYHSAGACSERTFELTVSPRTIGALSLSATAAQARGSNVVLTYAVTKACNVSVRVMNMAGRPIRDLVVEKPVTAGVQSELWNLCSATGTRVPSGMYLLQIEAVTDTGQRVRGMAQVKVTR